MSAPRREMEGRAAAAVLAGIALLGLAVRLYRLDAVSYDLDEYLSVRLVNMPSLGDFFRTFSFWAPDNVAPFFAAQYLAAQLFDNPERGMRLMSTAFGVGGILLAHAVGARAFGRRAGLVAAWCFALSPMQWWFAQSGRSSTFSNMAALASLYALLRLLETPRARGWLAALGLVNLALVWTHPMLGPFVAAEFAFLALLGLRRDRAPLWTAAALNGAVMATVLPVLLRRGRSMWQPADDFYMRLPSWKAVFYDLFGDDAAMTADPFLFQGPSWRALRDGVQEALLASHRWLDPALALFFVAVTAAAVFAALSGWRRARAGTDASRRRAEGVALLLAVAFLPFLMLGFLSLVWRPMLLPRYTLYSTVALYVLAGGMTARLRGPCLRTVCVAVPVLLYAAQALLVLPMNTRSPFREAGEFLRLNATPADLVVVRGSPMSWEIFSACAPECPAPHVSANSLRVAAELSARFLNSSPPGSQPSVWVLVEPYVYILPPPDHFSGALAGMGLVQDTAFFPGMNGITLHRVRRAGDAPAVETCPPGPLDTAHDYAGLAAALGLEGAAADQALPALRRAVDAKEWPRTRYYLSLLAFHLLADGETALAERAAARATELDPDFALGWLARAVTAAEGEGWAAASGHYDRAVALDPSGLLGRYRAVLEALYVAGDRAAAAGEIERLDRLFAIVPQVFRARAGVQAGAAWEPFAGSALVFRERAGAPEPGGEQP